MADKTSPASDRPAARARRREKPEQIADELRRLIISGELDEGDSLGHEPDLIERFGVSRPSLREALRILEAEGLISVIRGVLGGVVVHRPDQRQTARTAALVLQARNVSLADVFDARTIIEPAAVRLVAAGRGRRGRRGGCASSSRSRSRSSTTPRRSGRPTPGSTRSWWPWRATRP